MYEMGNVGDKFLIYCATGEIKKVAQYIKNELNINYVGNINYFDKKKSILIEMGNVTGLMIAVIRNQKEIVQLLLDNKAKTDIVTGSNEQNVLHRATMNKDIDPDIVSLLLKNMSPEAINQKDNRDRTPLDLSILSNNNKTTTLIQQFKRKQFKRKALKAKLLPYSKLRYKF